MTTPNMSCPSGGNFYACIDGSQFVGCCETNPCGITGCAAGNLVSTSFDAAQYGQIPDQSCSAGLFYTCAYTDPPFWGCCSISPRTDGCSAGGLSGAFLNNNAATAEPFARLNASYTNTTSTATPTPFPSSSDHNSSSHTGEIAGGIVGGLALLVAFVLGLLWQYRRRRQTGSAAVLQTTTEPQIQEMSSENDMAFKLGPQSYHNSPSIPSYPGSPPQPQYASKPPSYWSGPQRQHMSAELPGSDIQTEMDSSQTPPNIAKPRSSTDI